jgi:hypothetical protein
MVKKMTGLVLTFLAMFAAPAFGQAPDPLVGSWVVERFTDTPEGGAPAYPFGEQPVGLFVFAADGHFSFSVMRGPDREASNPAAAAAEWTPAWYVSYFGTYRYDPAGPSWTTRVLGGNIPSYVGTGQTRNFTLAGDVLTITAIYQQDGRTIRGERVLRRAGARTSRR